MTRTQVALWGAVFGGGVLFWASRIESIPYSDRRHSILLSIEAERQIGLSVFNEIKQKAARARALLPESHPEVQLIRSIGLRIANVASQPYEGKAYPHMQNLSWEFVVVNSDDVNAFVVPGGKVVVYTGLIRAMKGDDFRLMRATDKLAAVLAHEVAHIVARHAAERLTEQGILILAKIVIALLVGIDLPVGLSNVMLTLPNSRRAETEADMIGVRLMAKACFDPLACQSMLSTLGRAEKQDGDITPPFLRTHPITSDRVSKIKTELTEAMTLYADNNCHERRYNMRQTIRPRL